MNSKTQYKTVAGLLNYAAPVIKAQYPPGTTLFTSSIEVRIDDVLKTAGVDYNYNSSTNNVELLSDPGNDHALDITRVTSRTSRLVNYPSPTQLNQSHLNKDGYQWFFVIQELWDAVGERLKQVPTILSGALSYVWNFAGYRGVNCADPVDAQDVSTKAYTDLAQATAQAYADTQDDLHSTDDRAYADAQDDAHSVADYAAARGYTDGVAASLTATFNASQAAQDLRIDEIETTQNAIGLQITDLINQAVTAIMYPNSAPALLTYLNSGSTVCATAVEFVNALVFLGGFAQDPSTDYSHTTGNLITFDTAAEAYTQVQVYPVLNSVTQTATVAGDTITFTSNYDYGILFIDGVLIPPSDLTHVAGTNTVTLSGSDWDGGKALIFSAALIGEDERTLTPGTTTVDFGVTFRNAILFFDGIPQVNTLDYRHTGTDTSITILQSPPEDVSMVTYFFV